MKIIIGLFIFLANLLMTSVIAAEVSAKMIAVLCISCHGVEDERITQGQLGQSLRSSQELEEILLNFKYDRKPSTIMGRISKGYTDQELRSVALFFSRVK